MEKDRRYRHNTIMTLEECAEVLGYSPLTFRKWMDGKKIDRFYRGSYCFYRLRDMEILAWKGTFGLPGSFKSQFVRCDKRGIGAIKKQKIVRRVLRKRRRIKDTDKETPVDQTKL